jgi:hypothetical protein
VKRSADDNVQGQDPKRIKTTAQVFQSENFIESKKTILSRIIIKMIKLLRIMSYRSGTLTFCSTI